MGFLTQIFTWWNRQTLGTRLYTWRKGERVGEDALGNVYYQNPKPGPDGHPRRWVIFHGAAEASSVPADWHGWLHHTFEEPPVDGALPRQPFEKDHRPNPTGSPDAVYPPGSLMNPAQAAHGRRSYSAWSPDKGAKT